MDYVGPVYGSPLIPPVILYGYGAIIILSLLIAYRVKRVRQIIAAAHATGFILAGCIAGLLLIPVPLIRQTIRDQSKITIAFDHPVKRKLLQKSIMPAVPGIWAFEDPVYSTHLYRTLVFYPHEPLRQATTYTVTISGITNFLQMSPIESFALQLHTGPILSDASVLGIRHDVSEGNIAVLGIFPGDTWTGVGVDQPVRVQFNQAVLKPSAQSHVAITPATVGSFRWEGQTMEFWPEEQWLFNTAYTVYVGPGIQNSSGRESTYGYRITFTTQESVTKLAVPSYLQQYALSCEAAALRMALSYRGVTVSEDELLATIGTDPGAKNGSVWGNPYMGFVGSVRGKQMVHGYGVYWEPVARAARHYRHAESFSGWTLPKLTEAIQRRHPVIIWGYVTNGQPVVWYTSGGDKITGVADEHTVLVVGFVGSPSNPTYLIVNDPLTGEAYWTREQFEKKWQVFDQSGVLVY